MIKAMRKTIDFWLLLGVIGVLTLALALPGSSYAITTGNVTPLSVRHGFEKKHETGWEDATEEERQKYLKEMKEKKKKEDRLEERRVKSEEKKLERKRKTKEKLKEKKAQEEKSKREGAE